ncbi:hypothetical protein ABEB36_012176 [Hypothenemus hampei]|uniref:Uncharacterized protein n=1 Tax=Hypothenemus hampei TaxID=57062 RepID=A0ABD1EAA4_HYPHA
MYLKILLGLLLLLISTPINGEMNYLQAQLNHFLTHDSLYPAIPLPVGVIHCGKPKETDFVNNCLKNRHFPRQPVIIYCNRQLINEKFKFSHVLIFLTDNPIENFQVFYQQKSLWNSQTRFAFIFVIAQDDNLMEQFQKDFWSRFQVLNYIFVYVTENGTFMVHSFNPFNGLFKNLVNNSELFENKLRNLYGCKVTALWAPTGMSEITNGMVKDDNELFGYFAAQYLNLTLHMIISERYKPQVHAELVHKGIVDLDLNLNALRDVKNKFGITYNGPLITLLLKPSKSFQFDIYEVFDLHVWLLFSATFLILNICKLIALKSKHFPNIFAIDQVILTFCFVNFSQTVVTSVLALPLTQIYMETLEDLLKNNFTIYMTRNTEPFIDEGMDRRNIKILSLSDNLRKILDRQLLHKEAVVIWPKSYEKIRASSSRILDDYYVLKEPLGVMIFGRHINSWSPFKVAFEKVCVQLRETCSIPMVCVNVLLQVRKEDLHFQTLTVYDMFHVFKMLFVGLGCGLICFLGEILTFHLYNMKYQL